MKEKIILIGLILIMAVSLSGCSNAPKITQEEKTVEYDTPYLDAYDLIYVDGDAEYDVKMEGKGLDLSVLGEQTVTFDVLDVEKGKVYTKSFDYVVVDTIEPELELSDEEVTIIRGSNFDPINLVKKAEDEFDGKLDLSTVTVEGDYDINKEGTYVLSYTIADSSGNTATESLTLNIINADMKIDKEQQIGDSATITVKSCKFKKTVKPSNPRSYYSYYEADSGKLYYDVIIKAKNLLTEEAEMDNIIDATLTYDGKYIYDSMFITETKGDLEGYDWYSELDPLTTGTFHLLFELPSSAKSENKSIVITFTVDDVSAAYIAR